jgi:sporulation protein YunB
VRRKFGIHRRKGPPPLGRVFIITLILFFFSVFASLEIIDKQIKPTLMEIADQRVQQVVRLSISQAISKKMLEDLSEAKVSNAETNSQGNMIRYGWDPVAVNVFQRNAQYRLENFLKKIERGDPIPEFSLEVDSDVGEVEIDPEQLDINSTYYSIPLGQATNNTLLANLGPRIPIRFSIIGVAQTDIRLDWEQSGINNTLLKLFLDLRVSAQVVVPFSTVDREYTQSIYLDGQFIPGAVPDFYGGQGKGPEVTVPYDSLQ